MLDFKSKNAPNSNFRWAPLKTPLGELTTSPDPELDLRGLILLRKGKRWEWKSGKF